MPTWLMSVDIAGADRSQWKLKELELSSSTVAFISWVYIYSWWKPQADWKLQFHQFSSWSVCSGNVDRHELGRCYSLPFLLKYFLSRDYERCSRKVLRIKGFVGVGIYIGFRGYIGGYVKRNILDRKS